MLKSSLKTGITAVDKALDEIRAAISKPVHTLHYSWGASSLSTAVTNRFLYPWFDAAIADTTERRLVALHDGFLRNLVVRVATGADVSGEVTIAVRINGKDTPLSATFEQKASGVFVSRNRTPVPVKAQDLISVVAMKTAAPGVASGTVTAQFELVY